MVAARVAGRSARRSRAANRHFNPHMAFSWFSLPYAESSVCALCPTTSLLAIASSRVTLL
eukprot:6208703-Pleurochrysis_carterae.AAC.1